VTVIPELLSAALAGRYAIERELGRGAMATVYLAQDLKHHRKVAVKVLRPQVGAFLGAERFLSEIAMTAKLNHPHILALHDSGEARTGDANQYAFLYYVMPFVDGESLRDRLRREKSLGIAEAVRIATEVADALAYAHAHDIVHRDVKPENILLQAGHAVVADFGIARAVSAAESDRMTTEGLAVGTPVYMSPEQASAERDVDGRSDLYSLGCVTYEMLTGAPPFTGPTIDSILVQRFTRPPPRVSTALPHVPRHIDAAVHTAMACEPAERFATVALFAQALVTETQARELGPRDRSIAVLPFANMSADTANEYFSDGIAEEIINALTQLPHLRVAARTSTFSFKGRTADLRAIGEQLNVSTVLQGSVRKAGGRLRITVQLVDVVGGYHLWSERYDRELTDVFAIQDEIATAVARRLKVTLSAGEGLVRPPTDNLEAYDLFLKGRALVRQRGPAVLLAVESFEQAIRLDSALAPAHAELAEALLLVGLYGMAHPADFDARAAAATTKALALDATLVAAQLARGLLSLMSKFDRETAAAAWVRALELEPSNLEAKAMRAVFDYCYIRGEHERAIRELSAVVEADPLNAHVRAQLALALSWNRQSDRATVEARRGIELDPTAFYPHWTLLHALAFGPDPAQAAAIGPSILARFGRHPWIMMGLAWANGATGRQDTADALYSELAARARAEYVQPAALAVAAVGAGRRTDVLRHLGEAADIRDPLLALMILQWPGFSPVLRGDPAFVAVLRRWGWDRPVGSSTLETAAIGPAGP
jgi:eukaryotic-like serine/threonine-protein kinase